MLYDILERFVRKLDKKPSQYMAIHFYLTEKYLDFCNIIRDVFQQVTSALPIMKYCIEFVRFKQKNSLRIVRYI